MKNFSQKNEAAISGVGIISPIGNSPEEVLNSLRKCEDGIGVSQKIDTSPFASHICAEVKNFDFSSKMSPDELELFSDPFIRLALSAARLALEDAGIDFSKKNCSTAVVLASCNAGLNSREAQYLKKYESPSAIFDKSVCMQSEFYSLGKIFARHLNFGGESWIVNTACSGSTAAIGLAQTLLSSGKCNAVLVGGADAMALSNYAGFSAIRVVSAEKTAPFSTPVGMNIGEGAAFWVLENFDAARQRGAKIYGKVIGHATCGDAHHPTQPDPRGDGAFRTMRDALKNAGLEASQIGCINAHGSGTDANDKAESKGLAKFFESLGCEKIPITSTKSYAGHCMGATGIIEASCQLFAMNDNFIPPTLRNSGPRSGSEIEAVKGEGLSLSYDAFLSANYAFAGNNAAIVVAKSDFKDFKTPEPSSEVKRVVISGGGVVSSLGVEISENLDALENSKTGIAKSENFSSERMAGFVKIPNLRTIDRRIDFGGLNAISTFALIAGKKALDSAGIQVRRGNCEQLGLSVSVSRGASEAAHMKAVFSDPQRRGDISCFSNITANSTAGWVSKALEIKGPNITLTSGPHGALQSVFHAFETVKEGAASAVLALGADEVYGELLEAYDEIGHLHSGALEENFKLSFSHKFKTVMGEGAAAALIEDGKNAEERGAKILGEILSYASTMDCCDFLESNLTGDGLERAVNLALERAGICASDIDLVVWAPRGNAQDSIAISVCEKLFPSVGMLSNSLHTGFVETSSALSALVCALQALSDGRPLWRQITGVSHLDAKPIASNPKKILCLAGSDMANNYALIVGR